MAIPKYNEFMPTIITCLSDGNRHTTKELITFCANAFQLTEEERQRRLPTGRQSVLANRVGWAKTYLKKAGLIENPVRSTYCLTQRGKEAYQQGVENITVEYLRRFDSFNAFISNDTTQNIVVSNDNTNDEEISKSPQEILENAIKQINHSLADELLTEIMKISSSDFESLVVRLLIKMGYGSMQLNANAVTKKSGDEGIDGIVTADKFGFDSIYIQAKKWNTDTIVGRPEIQKFLGALVGQGATKGVFITTAKFSSGAYEYAKKQLNTKIVLIDGDRLTNLMIEYNLGVSVIESYEIKRIDYDFFNEDI